MQANRQIQNYQAFVLFKKRKTARASGLIRRTPAFFSAIFLVRLLHAPISRAVRRKTAAATEIVRPSGDKVHRPPRARVKVRVERFALRVHGHQHALALFDAGLGWRADKAAHGVDQNVRFRSGTDSRAAGGRLALMNLSELVYPTPKGIP